MTKTRTPFFSLGAQGSVGRSITAQKRNSSTLLREKPLPSDPYSLPQAYQRWLYEDYAYLWTKQSAATKQTYATAGSRFHLTGFQYWMKAMLSTLPDIMGLWHLDEKAGTIAYDSSRQGNNGTIIGASPADSLIDGAQYFDGLNDLIQIPTSPSLHLPAEFTIELFFKNAHLAAWQIILQKGQAIGTREYSLRMSATDVFIILLGNATGAWGLNWNTGWVPITGTFYHVLVTRISDVVYLYIDGVFENSTPYATTIKESPLALHLGNDLGTSWIKGTIDHLVIRNRILDPTEILRHSLRRYPAQ